MTAVKLEDILPEGRVKAVHGRVRIVLNGTEYELDDLTK
jgi:hypothetical protein